MRRALLWIGVILYVGGVVVVLAKLVMSYQGYSVANQALQVLADPVWHLGPVMFVIGAAFLALWRRLSRMIDQV